MRLVVMMLVACGSSQPAPAPSPRAKAASPAAVAQTETSEVDKAEEAHQEITEAHRKGEEEQQDALGAQCDEPPPPKSQHERCLPSCYTTEPPDPRAGNKKVVGAVEIEHVVCKRSDDTLVLADEAGKLRARTFTKRIPAAHKKGSWQEAIEVALREKLPRGDAVVVTGGWRNVKQPLTKETLRCVMVAHYTRLHRALDACAGIGETACEASGNPAARAINVVHYRLAEAKRLQAAGKTGDCQQAALEAIAVARGLPRWRQYAKLNVAKWKDGVLYRTRFDGMLDEDGLFATTATLGSEAETVYGACGGPASAPTTPEQEQSFHTCW